MRSFQVESGSAHPLGVSVCAEGVNFSLFSQSATGVVLLLFESARSTDPFQTIRFDPYENKTFHFWHAFVRGCPAGLFYGYRIEGPTDVAAGDRFNPNKVLIGPYARGISRELWQRAAAIDAEDNVATSMRCAIVDTSTYDWEGDKPLNRPIHESVIYELHVGGFTRSPTSHARHAGTFAGVIEKIPYLQALGVTAVELLPVFEFDDTDVRVNAAGDRIYNYWGYSPVGFFSPHSGYCIEGSGPSAATEFRDLVKALHRAEIEVILDVVFNHTDEGDVHGPMQSFRGIDNRSYYLLDPSDPSRYLDFSGCGNTVNANHPLLQKLIVDSLCYWVREMHVDGFRFDEGTILARGEDGRPLEHPPVIWQIEMHDDLGATKMIAEAWDAAGLYQVGHFPGDRWAEWNGRYRDDVRRFVKGDAGMVGLVAARLGGSADIYAERGQTPENSINFVTVHDGFTMNDLVSYDDRHNEANGEDNRDGIAENLSWNCGVEGPTADPAINALRVRQMKNFFTILLLSRGVPMLLAGDEIRRTQGGNNNAYNQDNPTSWIDWTLAEPNRDMLRFVQRMIGFRKRHPALWQPVFYTGAARDDGRHDVAWHGTRLGQPGFADPEARVLACTIAGVDGTPDLHVMMNMYWEPLEFEVAPGVWQVAVDTWAPAPYDIIDVDEEGRDVRASLSVEGRSIVVLRSATS